jgi:hypothetical protein
VFSGERSSVIFLDLENFCDGGAAPRPPQAATRPGKPAPTIGPGSGPIARIRAKPTSTAEDVEKGKELVARYRTAERDEQSPGWGS